MRDLASSFGPDTSPGTRNHETACHMEMNYYADRLTDRALTRHLDDSAIEQAIVHLIHEIRDSARGLTKRRYFVEIESLLDHCKRILEIAWSGRSWKILLTGSFVSWEGYWVGVSVTEPGAVGTAHKELRRRAVALV